MYSILQASTIEGSENKDAIQPFEETYIGIIGGIGRDEAYGIPREKEVMTRGGF